MHTFNSLCFYVCPGDVINWKEVDLDFYMCATKHQVFGGFE